MKKAGPIALRLAQTEITDGHPVSHPTGSDQSNGKDVSEVAHNIERAIRRSIIDNHQLSSLVLTNHTSKCRGEEPLSVVRRHND
jgi:hypothetical protein